VATAFVTGGSGFIGGRLIERLVAYGEGSDLAYGLSELRGPG
jgi:nucleoside-diphosphate-sugar epimerase